MIGSTAQQFLTFLSHRGEETGNIRGSMKVRVPTERLGTRERLYGGGSIGRVWAWDRVVWIGGGGERPRVDSMLDPRILGGSTRVAGSGHALRNSWEGAGRLSGYLWDPGPQVVS
jgi:hypothetical protein